MEFNEELVARAIRQEIERGGQVYYLHNRVETIQEIHLFLQGLVPEVSIAVAHGQMEDDELEEVMRSFVHGERQMLLSTTIIENGLDIPNVNTIIIDRADMLGVSQLYQLRGRVGRAGIPAFAYLFYPDRRALSEIAMKRLRIISDHTELGSGFKIALKDLEIRGAGNILGREQHGYILSVGYDLYLKMLDEAVAALSKESAGRGARGLPGAGVLGLHPRRLHPGPHGKDGGLQEDRRRLHRARSSTGSTRRSRTASGPIPDEVQSVLALAEIRIICRRLFITSIKEEKGTLRVEFSRLSKVSVDRIVRMVREGAGRVSLDPQDAQLPAPEDGRHRPAGEVGVPQGPAGAPGELTVLRAGGTAPCDDQITVPGGSIASLGMTMMPSRMEYCWIVPVGPLDAVDADPAVLPDARVLVDDGPLDDAAAADADVRPARPRRSPPGPPASRSSPRPCTPRRPGWRRSR